MKNYNKILEAVNRGIQLALDDFDDDALILNNIKSKQVLNRDYTKEYLDLMDLLTIAVDLGLPSGTLWCKYNLGCNFDKLNTSPENTKPKNWYGSYYAWGEIKPKKKYTLETYKWKLKNRKDGGKRINSVYNSQLKELLPKDDAAYLNMHFENYNFGNYKFHIPTKELFEELIEYTTNEQVENYKNIPDLNGMIFTGKNGNKLFLPTAGFYYDKSDGLSYTGSCGTYWTSTLYVFDDDNEEYEVYDDAYLVRFDNTLSLGFSLSPTIYKWARYNGYSIRPVVDKRK